MVRVSGRKKVAARKERLGGRYTPIRPKPPKRTTISSLLEPEEIKLKPYSIPKRRRKGRSRAAQRKTARKLKRISFKGKPTKRVSLIEQAKPRDVTRKSKYKFAYGGTEGVVVSPRGRAMARGVTDPFAKPPEDQPQGVQDYFLSSRAIRRFGYDIENGVLLVIFQTGYGYHFFKVPLSVWINFQAAQSKGRFFMSQIYGHWTGKEGSKTYHPNYNYARIQ